MKNFKTYFLFKISLDFIAFSGILFQVIFLIQMWSSIPDEVPVHFDLFGKPDAWGEKKSLLLMPVITIIIFSIFTVFSHSSRLLEIFLNLPPFTEKTKRLYRKLSILIQLFKVDIVWLFSLLEFQIIQITMGRQKGWDYTVIIFIAIAVVIVILFNIIKFREKVPR